MPDKKLALGHDNKPRRPASAAKGKRRRGAIINPKDIKGRGGGGSIIRGWGLFFHIFMSGATGAIHSPMHVSPDCYPRTRGAG